LHFPGQPTSYVNIETPKQESQMCTDHHHLTVVSLQDWNTFQSSSVQVSFKHIISLANFSFHITSLGSAICEFDSHMLSPHAYCWSLPESTDIDNIFIGKKNLIKIKICW